MQMSKLIILSLLMTTIGISGCITIDEITPLLSSQTPFVVKTGEVVTFTAQAGGSTVSGATVKVSYVNPSVTVNMNDVYIATMTTIGTTNNVGELSYTIPSGYAGKKLVYYIEKTLSLSAPGIGTAMVT